MITLRRRRWSYAAILVGIAYVVVGRTFGWPTDHVIAWRYAAWLVCGIAFGAHIWYDHRRWSHSPRAVALHASLAVAIGGFGLAVAGMAHSFSSTGFRPVWLVALVAFPLITAVPAFLAALVAASVLARIRPSEAVDQAKR